MCGCQAVRSPAPRRGFGVAWIIMVTMSIGGAGAAPLGAASLESCDRESVRHLLNRASWGPRPGQVDEVCRMGPEAWLERQLRMGSRLGAAPPRLPAQVAEHLAEHRSDGLDPAALRSAFPPPQELRDRADELSPAERRMRTPARLNQELATRRLAVAIHAEDQLRDVMTSFWIDHFNVSVRKGPLRWLVQDFEDRAIRPHVFGSFEEMLVAVASHPAMLVFLDNVDNVAADSMRPGAGMRRVAPPGAAGGRARARGGNENYARELMELHTLGVDGGYTEHDVREVARAFTGWGAEPGGVGGFTFRPALHDVGPKVVLGERLAPARGIEDGMEVLAMLARHPSTAAHLARKLAVRFVNEEGDPEMEAALASRFLETGGDLAEVTLTLFTHARFDVPENHGAVFRSPFEFSVAAVRAVDGVFAAPGGVSRSLLEYLREAGHTPWGEDSPEGPPVGAEHWAGSAGLLARMKFAGELAVGRVDGVRSPLLRAAGSTAGGRAGRGDVAARSGPFGDRLTPVLEILFPEGPPSGLDDLTDDPARLLVLGLGGPAFQWK
jgi:uncharacterized protein (DUF1800 family)